MVSLMAVLLSITAVYIAVLFWAARRESERFQLVGPLLMVRTQAGKRTINEVSKWKGWGRVADLFVVLTVIAGLLMVVLVVWQNTLLFTHTEAVREEPPQVEQALAIPGVNPVIPVGYGIFALVVALVIHEGGHGVMCRFSDLKVKSLGLLFLIVPIGAFVEPDEASLQGATLREKLRMFASGPGPNMVLGAACVLLFSQAMVPALTPAQDGVAMMNVNDGLPADEAGLEPGDFVVGINHTGIQLTEDARSKLNQTYPDASWSWNRTEGPGADADAPPSSRTLNLTYRTDGQQGTLEAQPVDKYRWHERNAPDANDPSFKNAPLLIGFDRERIETSRDFQAALDVDYPDATWSWNHTAGPGAEDPNATGHEVAIEITYVRDGETRTTTLEPTDKYLWYEENAPGANQERFKDEPFLGVGPADGDRLQGIVDNLVSPFENQGLQGAIFYLALPFVNLAPFPTAFHAIFTPTGFFAGWGTSFWVTANTLYWLFWLNVVLGTFNALPMGPLDGGHMFRHSMHSWLRRRRGIGYEDLRVLDTEDRGPTFVGRSPAIQEQLDIVDRRVQIANRILGFTLLGLLVAPLVIPYFL